MIDVSKDREADKAKKLDKFLEEGKRYTFDVKDVGKISAEYDQMTVDDEGFVIYAKNVDAPETEFDGLKKLIIVVKDIENAEQSDK